MDTINNIAGAATRAIWGPSNDLAEERKEPISGVQGNTSNGEPFDAGNMGWLLPLAIGIWHHSSRLLTWRD